MNIAPHEWDRYLSLVLNAPGVSCQVHPASLRHLILLLDWVKRIEPKVIPCPNILLVVRLNLDSHSTSFR